MGRLRRELTDPWGVIVAGTVGGIAGVLVSPGLLVGAAVGAAVYGVKVAAGTLLGDAPERPAPPARVRKPMPGTPAGTWLSRAEQAVRQLDDMAHRSPATGGAVDEATVHAASEATVALEQLRRLGAQVVDVDEALSHSDSPDLEDEVRRLRAASDNAPGDVSAKRSADAVADRLAVRDRLRAAQADLVGRLQSSALGLEGLVARVAEVRAAGASAGQLDPTADDLASLNAEVEGLRVGLAEVEKSTQEALGSG